MASHAAFLFGGLLLVLCTTGSSVLAETGCPPEETILPCVCEDRPSTRLVCSGIQNTTEISQVFENAARYTFQEVHIRSSTFEYVHDMIFRRARIYEMYFDDCTLNTLFLWRPTTPYLEKLQLNNTRILKQNFYVNLMLKEMKGLKTLIVNNYKGIRKLDVTFSQNLPGSLKQIILRGTDLEEIDSDTFFKFKDLDKLEVSYSNLRVLKNFHFPRPFNVRFLYLDNNNISTIDKYLFNDMPDLQFLSLKNNKITEVPEATFGNRRTIPYLKLDGNPLQCNCLLLWLIKNKPEIIGGTCHFPKNLLGRELQDLQPYDFNC